MCLYTTEKHPTIISEDMIVYKVLTEELDAPFINLSFRYELNKIFKLSEKFKISVIDSYHEIDRIFDSIESDILARIFSYKVKNTLTKVSTGFHSTSTEERLQPIYRQNPLRAMRNAPPLYIFKCKIPKGSKIYKSITDLIVSDTIIILERVCSP